MYDDDCSERPVRRIPKREALDVSPKPTGRLYDYAQSAEYLAVTERMVRRLWETRRIGAVKVGRHVRFTEAELERFVRDNSTGGAA